MLILDKLFDKCLNEEIMSFYSYNIQHQRKLTSTLVIEISKAQLNDTNGQNRTGIKYIDFGCRQSLDVALIIKKNREIKEEIDYVEWYGSRLARQSWIQMAHQCNIQIILDWICKTSVMLGGA